MTFLSWQTLAWAAGLTIPPLVALYFLKLKRAVRVVPSTLLWKKTVEDLHVNSPFQRLKSSLLLLLQLLVLALAAVALGKPMWERAQTAESTMILLVDQSASMGVLETSGRTRLDEAKDQAKRCIDNMSDESRAMVIAFCDRASVVSSFDTNKQSLKRKIDSIEQTQSTTTLGEALSLAEAYTQNIIIGTEQAGADKGPDKPATPASVYLFTDGRVEDADKVVLQKFEVEKMTVTSTGTRSDNVGILAMEARRNYEKPEVLEVAATIQNFGEKPVTFDAVLEVEGRVLDIKSVQLEPGYIPPVEGAPAASAPPPGSIAVAAFEPIEFSGAGVIQAGLRIDDALPADDKAWAIVEEPRHVKVLLVTDGNMFLESVLPNLPIHLSTVSGESYETTDEAKLVDGDRNIFDVVIFDRHSTARLPQGNYMFWGCIPKIDGVGVGRLIDNEILFNWDETHPVLRHVAADSIFVNEWFELKLPAEAVSIIDGQTSPVLAYFARDGRQYLICAFSLIVEKDGNQYHNTSWYANVDFVIFMQNVVQFLASNVAAAGQVGVLPGQPVTLPIPEKTEHVSIHRPDDTVDRVTAGGYQTVHYARTRQVGVYSIEPGVEGHDKFAINLFNATESNVMPSPTLKLGASQVESKASTISVNQPAWPYFLMALLGVLLLEWVVYNKRIFV